MAARPGTRTRRNAPPTYSRRLIELQACIEFLDATGRLARVRSEVDPRHELAGIARRFEGGKCVLFERVKGSDYPVLAGLLWLILLGWLVHLWSIIEAARYTP